MNAAYTVSPLIKTKKRRLSLRERALPRYTRGEEIFNMVTHIVGGGMGVITLTLCVLIAALSGNVAGVVCGAIFGASMIILYTSSSIYHGLRACLGKKVFQVLDHCTIYFLIAGTYTPLLICCLTKTAPISAYVTLGAVWGLCTLAITLTAINMEKYKVFSMIAYIGVGWAIIFSLKPMLDALGYVGFALLFGGGVIYTVGTIFFKLGTKKKYFHSIFHIFVLLGSICHALCVLLCAM